MPLPIFVVDAFTDTAFAGNPAAVVLGSGNEAWMQALAAEMRHSETAYVVARPDGDYDLRWFTPEVEVSLCGHATLASAHVLYTSGLVGTDAAIAFHTRSGVLRASHAGDAGVTLDFPATEPAPHDPLPHLFAALGVSPKEFLRTDAGWFMCVVDDAESVRTLTPDFAALRALPDVRGVYVTAAGDDDRFDIVSRCFAPAVGIDEDPVTGSMHCALVAYWGPQLGRDELRACQASARGGVMTVGRAGDRALLTGRCVTVLAGELQV